MHRWKSCAYRELYVRTTCNDLGNESTKLIEPKTISHIMQPRIESIYDVELSDGRILQITDSHPIMLTNASGCI